MALHSPALSLSLPLSFFLFGLYKSDPSVAGCTDFSPLGMPRPSAPVLTLPGQGTLLATMPSSLLLNDVRLGPRWCSSATGAPIIPTAA